MDLAFLQGKAVQKALGFFVMMLFGAYLRTKITDKAQINGIKALIMQGLLPCVIFKSLVGISMTPDMIYYPVGAAAYILFQLTCNFICGQIIFPGDDLAVPRRTAAFLAATFAPGLSAFVFITEFVGPWGTGLGAFMDLASKLYLLVVLKPTMEAFAPGSKPKSKSSGGGGGGLGKAIFGDPLNMAIICGIGMSLMGIPITKLKFIGTAIETLAGAQTPVLFILVGLTFKLGGNTPVVCAMLMLLRAGLALLFASTAITVFQMDADNALVIIIMCQAATSVVGWGQMNKVCNEGTPGYDAEFAFDIVGYSFPITVMLNTTACVLKEPYIANSFAIAMVYLGLAFGLFVAFRSKIQDVELWKKAIKTD